MLPATVFLLEDNPERLAEMLAVLREVLPHHEVHVENDCNAAIRWLEGNQECVDLISLDHDLDSVPRNEEAPVDHGCGRGVADFLAKRPATCSVIIHTSNATAGDGMFYELQYAKWPLTRVYPHDHHQWVRTDWKQTLEHLIQQGWINP